MVKNGRIVDGSGTDSYAGDVAVKSGRIVAVGAIDGDAREMIDADGRAVTPGFVDVHTHYDAQVFWDPLLTSSCWHGAFASFEERVKGSITPGKLADLVVLGEDPTQVDPDSLIKIPVEKTMVDGKFVWDQEA